LAEPGGNGRPRVGALEVLAIIGKVVAVAVATVAIIGAVAGSGLPGWLRAVFVAIAVGALLLTRVWEQVAWPDVAALAVTAIAVIVAIAAWAEEEPDPKDPETVPFVVAADKAVAATQLDGRSSIVVLTLEPNAADDGNVLTYVSTRYEATLCHGLPPGPGRRDVAITIERGDQDGNAKDFAADLRGAETVHLLPPTEKPEGTAAETGNAKPKLPSGCPSRPADVRAPEPARCRTPLPCGTPPPSRPCPPEPPCLAPSPCPETPEPEPEPELGKCSRR
jgi:hypothetical protein